VGDQDAPLTLVIEHDRRDNKVLRKGRPDPRVGDVPGLKVDRSREKRRRIAARDNGRDPVSGDPRVMGSPSHMMSIVPAVSDQDRGNDPGVAFERAGNKLAAPYKKLAGL